MAKIIRLTEADLTRLVRRVMNEQEKGKVVPCSKIGVKTNGYCDSITREVLFVQCSDLGVKTPGYCEHKTKKPVVQCSKIGVKHPGICYRDNGKICR